METHWDTLRSREGRDSDRTWTLTGDVDVERDGSLLALEATRADDGRHETATRYFDRLESTDSPNPGNLGDHFDRLERSGKRQYLVVQTPTEKGSCSR